MYYLAFPPDSITVLCLGKKLRKRSESTESSGNSEGERVNPPKFHRAKSIESEDDSVGIGKGGNRFLKKKKPEPSPSVQKEQQATTSRNPCLTQIKMM